MKTNFLFFYLILFSYSLFAEPDFLGKKIWHTDEYGYVCISKNKIEFDDKVEEGELVHYYGVDAFKGSKNDYIILNGIISGAEFLYLIKNSQEEKQIYGSWEMTYLTFISECPYTAAKLVPFKVKKASAFIIEKDKLGNEIRFLPEHNNFFFLGSNPWAVKEDDDKKIYLDTERWRNPYFIYKPIEEIVFVNGFVFPSKEYLFEQNSRAKRVKISYDKTSFETELKDTGNFQVVHLPDSIDSTKKNNIEIEILDYYVGTKYSDIVISGVYYIDAVLEKRKN